MESSANSEQIEYWNQVAGPKWVRLEAQLDAQIGPLGDTALERAAVASGERVLDVGCGCGASSLELGRRVGATGSVLGLDITQVMLERARQRAAREGLSQVRFEQGDAQVAALLPAHYDLVFSRFGVMFFEAPEAAFRNLARALRPGGRVAFLCWQALDRNPWMRIPMGAALALLPAQPPRDPHAPGPFAFADADRVTKLLERAGLREVGFEPLEREMLIGGGADLEHSVAFMLQLGPTSALLREASPELRGQVAAAVREAIAPFATREGVRMPAAAWVVSARAGSAAAPRAGG